MQVSFRHYFAVFAMLTYVSQAQVVPVVGWRPFRSATGFSVVYPNVWLRVGISKDRLDIRSSKGGAEAIGINRGQGEIVIMEEEGAANKTLAQVMDRYTRDTTVLSRGDIHNSGAGACRTLKEVVAKEPVVPPADVTGSVPYLVVTEFFCEVDGHKYVTVLRNFEKDKNQTSYQQIALRVAESLRLNR